MLLLISFRTSVSFLLLGFLLILLWELIIRDNLSKLALVLNRSDQHSNIVFGQLDIDSNGQLSFEEWIPYFTQSSEGHRNPSKESPLIVSRVILRDVFDENDSVLSVKANFQPMLLNFSMKNFKEENVVRPGSMLGLLNWQVPYKPWQNFAAKEFAIFFPPPEVPLSPGNVWWIVAPQQTSQLPSDRYEPQPTSPRVRLLQDLLQMFHPRVSLLTRFPPQGTAAVIRATNKDIVEILFRCHVEFQLNERPALPFWFTPAQFQGHVILHRNSSQVEYFSMAVPNSRPLNVDMEWMFGLEPDQMEVDLGFLPEMKLVSTSPSIRSSQLGEMRDQFIHGMHSDLPRSAPKYKWDKEIPEAEAWSILESRFFAFKNVPYYNISDVFEKAKQEDKLVHTLVLFGSLDDQSC